MGDDRNVVKASMRLHECYFCGSTCYPGHGISFVRNDAKVFRFCRSKCHKNFKMKRNPRKVRWTKAFRRTNNKELAVDSTFDFEKRRNRPVKYDRELMAKTVKALKQVEGIKAARQKRHWIERMKQKQEVEHAEKLKEVEKYRDLVQPSVATRVPKALLKVGITELTKRKTEADKESEAFDASVAPPSFSDAVAEITGSSSAAAMDMDISSSSSPGKKSGLRRSSRRKR